MRNTLRHAVIAVSLTVATITSSLAVVTYAHADSKDTPTDKILVRWCPEDAVQVGVGDFDGHRWSRYVCIARDDL